MLGLGVRRRAYGPFVFRTPSAWGSVQACFRAAVLTRTFHDTQRPATHELALEERTAEHCETLVPRTAHTPTPDRTREPGPATRTEPSTKPCKNKIKAKRRTPHAPTLPLCSVGTAHVTAAAAAAKHRVRTECPPAAGTPPRVAKMVRAEQGQQLGYVRPAPIPVFAMADRQPASVHLTHTHKPPVNQSGSDELAR